MTTVHDDIATLPEDSIESPYGNILERSQLAQHLSQIYNSLGQHEEVLYTKSSYTVGKSTQKFTDSGIRS